MLWIMYNVLSDDSLYIISNEKSEVTKSYNSDDNNTLYIIIVNIKKNFHLYPYKLEAKFNIEIAFLVPVQ